MLTIRPLSLKAANKYVALYHRHHGTAQGYKFALCVNDEFGNTHGVAIVGRPINRNLDDSLSVEVTRLCTDGFPNACSMLYAAAWRTSREMGYQKIYTYILDTENGSTLKAAGWHLDGHVSGRSWGTASRPRTDKHPLCDKCRWVKQSGRTNNAVTKQVEVSPKKRMAAGALFTHRLRVTRSEKLVRNAIKDMLKNNTRPTKTAVSKVINISREQLSRRYSHLFRDV